MKYRKEDLPKIIALSLVLVAAVVWAVVANVRTIQRYSGGGGAEPADATTGPAERGARAGPISPPAMWAGMLTPVPPPSRDPFDPVIAPRWQRERARPAAEQPGPSSPPPAPPPLPGSVGSESLHLTGIIYGPPSIVVLRKGEEVYILKQGDYVEGGMRVDAVTRTSVTLRDRQGTYILRLGG